MDTQHVRTVTVLSSLPDDHAVSSVLYALCNFKMFNLFHAARSELLSCKAPNLTWNVLSLVLVSNMAARHCKSRLWSSFLGLLQICDTPAFLQDAGLVELLARNEAALKTMLNRKRSKCNQKTMSLNLVQVRFSSIEDRCH